MTPVHEAEASEALWERLTESVRLHLVSDVPVGAFLSGGVDSSAILSIMVHQSREPVSTFSVGFREDRFNELPYARRVAEHFGTKHYELRVEPANLDVLERVLAAFDEPFADASAIPTFLVSRLAREHVKVVLSGDGGDELFAGYDRYLIDHRRRHASLLSRAGLARPLRALSTLLPEGTPGKNYAYNLSLPRMERYLDAISIFPPRVLRDTIDGDHLAVAEDPLTDLVEEGAGLDALSRLQLIDLQSEPARRHLDESGSHEHGKLLGGTGSISRSPSRRVRLSAADGASPPLRGAEVLAQEGPARKASGRGAEPTKAGIRGAAGGMVLEGSTGLLRRSPRETEPAWRRSGFAPSAIRDLVDLYRKKQREDHCRRLWALTVLERSLRNLERHAA